MKSNLVFILLVALICSYGPSVFASPVEGDQKVESDADGYTDSPGIGAIKLHKTAKTWNEARKTCIEEGAHLLIIRTAAELDLVNQTAIADSNIWQIWLGVHELYKEGEWTTVLDEPLAKVGFAPWRNSPKNGQEPNHTGGVEHCVSYITDWSGSGLNDARCEREYPFFCKKNPPCPEK